MPFLQYSIFLLYLGALYLARGDTIEPVLEISEVDSNFTDGQVTETQHAICKIATEELVANAHATVTRVLDGACSAKTIDERFESLEKNLMKELDEIKEILYAVLEKRSFRFRSITEDLKNATDAEIDYKHVDTSPRQAEIDLLNATAQEVTHLNGSRKVFNYYWQVEDFDEKLATWTTTRSQRSPTFYVERNGYAMYLEVTPRYFPDGTVFVGVGLTRGRYDSILQWPFPRRIRLEILDHSPSESRQDRRSRIWNPALLCTAHFWGRPKLSGDPDNPVCVGLSTSREMILSKVQSLTYDLPRTTRYLWKGSLIVKLSVYY